MDNRAHQAERERQTIEDAAKCVLVCAFAYPSARVPPGNPQEHWIFFVAQTCPELPREKGKGQWAFRRSYTAHRPLRTNRRIE